MATQVYRDFVFRYYDLDAYDHEESLDACTSTTTFKLPVYAKPIASDMQCIIQWDTNHYCKTADSVGPVINVGPTANIIGYLESYSTSNITTPSALSSAIPTYIDGDDDHEPLDICSTLNHMGLNRGPSFMGNTFWGMNVTDEVQYCGCRISPTTWEVSSDSVGRTVYQSATEKTLSNVYPIAMCSSLATAYRSSTSSTTVSTSSQYHPLNEPSDPSTAYQWNCSWNTSYTSWSLNADTPPTSSCKYQGVSNRHASSIIYAPTSISTDIGPQYGMYTPGGYIYV